MSDVLFQRAKDAEAKRDYWFAAKLYKQAQDGFERMGKLKEAKICRNSIDNIIVTDEFGTYRLKHCQKCGGEMIVIRPGDIRCSKCEN